MADDSFNWDDLRYLLGAVRAGTLAGASRAMGVEHTTVGRRLSSLEQALSVPLVLRGPEGLRLTPMGEAVVPLVEEVERAVSAVRDLVAAQRVAIGEGRLIRDAASALSRWRRPTPSPAHLPCRRERVWLTSPRVSAFTRAGGSLRARRCHGRSVVGVGRSVRHVPAAIDVTALGLVSSVGHDAITACASIRAGISRPGEIPGMWTLDLSSGEPMPMKGHPIVPITNGFLGTARWLQLAPWAFDDLVRNGGLPGPEDVSFWSSTAVILLLPNLEESRFEHDPRSQPTEIAATLVAPLRRRLPASLPQENIRVQPLGRVGLAAVVAGFRDLVDELRVNRVIALGVDSHLCPFALNWLGESGRLKDSVNPVGLVPGEAAGALLLEARQRSGERSSVARIVTVATGKDAAWVQDDEAAPVRGRELSEVLRPLLTDETGDLYLDLNGEDWRAQEYGHAATALAPWDSKRLSIHCPAAEIGDTGAAGFVVNTIVAARSLQRGYARGRQVAVATSMETGEVAGLLLGSQGKS